MFSRIKKLVVNKVSGSVFRTLLAAGSGGLVTVALMVDMSPAEVAEFKDWLKEGMPYLQKIFVGLGGIAAAQVLSLAEKFRRK